MTADILSPKVEDNRLVDMSQSIQISKIETTTTTSLKTSSEWQLVLNFEAPAHFRPILAPSLLKPHHSWGVCLNGTTVILVCSMNMFVACFSESTECRVFPSTFPHRRTLSHPQPHRQLGDRSNDVTRKLGTQ